jgi:hypothetical protein
MNDVPLKEYIEARFDALRIELDHRERINQRAIEKAEQALLTRLEGMNQFRAQILEERGELARRVDLEALEKRLYAMEASVGNHERAIIRIDLSLNNTASRMWSVVTTVTVTLVVALISFMASRTWTNWVIK